MRLVWIILGRLISVAGWLALMGLAADATAVARPLPSWILALLLAICPLYCEYWLQRLVGGSVFAVLAVILAALALVCAVIFIENLWLGDYIGWLGNLAFITFLCFLSLVSVRKVRTIQAVALRAAVAPDIEEK